jgi:hypothetical protein
MKYKKSLLGLLIILMIGNIINYFFFKGDGFGTLFNIFSLFLISLGVYISKKNE